MFIKLKRVYNLCCWEITEIKVRKLNKNPLCGVRKGGYTLFLNLHFELNPIFHQASTQRRFGF